MTLKLQKMLASLISAGREMMSYMTKIYSLFSGTEKHTVEPLIVDMLARSYNTGGRTVTLSKGHKCVTSTTRLPVIR